MLTDVDATVEKSVRAAYGDRADEALSLLGDYTSKEPERVRRAVLTLADGDIGRLRHFIDVAQQDYRDVLYWAEYPREPLEPRTYEELRERLNLPPEP
jgi:hypothetical protein